MYNWCMNTIGAIAQRRGKEAELRIAALAKELGMEVKYSPIEDYGGGQDRFNH